MRFSEMPIWNLRSWKESESESRSEPWQAEQWVTVCSRGGRWRRNLCGRESRWVLRGMDGGIIFSGVQVFVRSSVEEISSKRQMCSNQGHTYEAYQSIIKELQSSRRNWKAGQRWSISSKRIELPFVASLCKLVSSVKSKMNVRPLKYNPDALE